MKKLLLILAISFLHFNLVNAGLNDRYSGIEESACFELLNEAVKNDSRFKDSDLLPNGDLTSVLYDEVNNSYFDFSKYSNFWYQAVKNPANNGGSTWDDYYFEARRNNIGTIIGNNNYIYSQIGGFGRDSNFDFPLESKTGIPYGDKYTLNGSFFKEYVLYTHHVIESGYPLLSCGIVKITPLGGRTFSDISEGGFMTNILNGIDPQPNLGGSKCSSGFEGETDSQNGYDFYKMKSNTCVLSYDESDYLKQEVISIAFDNDSKRLNEYYTHPIQVEVMNNNSNHADGLAGIQEAFSEKLDNETCYKVIHGSGTGNLPAHCSGSFGPISYQSTNFSLLDYLFPEAYADRSEGIDLPEPTPEQLKDGGMLVYGNLSYKLYKKLDAIPDENFKEYMTISVLPNFEEIIEHRSNDGVLLTPFEEVFLSCDLDYTERLDVVSEFLEQLDVDNFTLSALDYTNETYGDCIIPYPDKDKIDIVVEGSFDSNQLLAEKLNGTYIAESDSQDVNDYLLKRDALLKDLNEQISEIDSRFNTGEIDIDTAFILKQEKQDQIRGELEAIEIESEVTEENKELIIQDSLASTGEPQNNYLIYSVILLLVLLGGSFVRFSFHKKNKK